jgi:predicted nucleic acid-binding protein
MRVQTVIKRAIKRLELEGNLLTPDAYMVAFCKEANKVGMIVEDCNQVEKFSRTLNTEFQKDLLNYNIKTLSEFIRFLISRLNRSKNSNQIAQIESQNALLKKILEVVLLFQSKHASTIAKQNINFLNSSSNDISELNRYNQLWSNFFKKL